MWVGGPEVVALATVCIQIFEEHKFCRLSNFTVQVNLFLRVSQFVVNHTASTDFHHKVDFAWWLVLQIAISLLLCIFTA